jgi:hypothetical protein
MGGAVSRIDPEATALGEREVGFDISFAAAWPPYDAGAEGYKAWVREGWDRSRPHSTGVYANFISDEGTEGVKAAYGDRLERLTRLKSRYDPTNTFRLNANIPPQAQANALPENDGDVGAGSALLQSQKRGTRRQAGP